jgi:hypothetical protein
VSNIHDVAGWVLIVVSAAAISRQLVILRPIGWRAVATGRGLMLRVFLVFLLGGVFAVTYSGRPSAGGWLLTGLEVALVAWTLAVLLRGRFQRSAAPRSE